MRLPAACLMLLLAATPAGAEERVDQSALPIEENEPPVMRIVFDDCLGFVRDGEVPFEGLKTFPIDAETLERSGSVARRFVPVSAQAAHLLEDRYVAAWGRDDRGFSFCTLSTAWGATSPRRLGVRAEGFVARLAARAKREGLSEAFFESPDLHPLEIPSISEPGDDPDELRFSIATTSAGPDRTLVDVGLLVMGGGRP